MLSSGVMDVRGFLDEGLKVAIGTDVAGGYSASMLDAIRQVLSCYTISDQNPVIIYLEYHLFLYIHTYVHIYIHACVTSSIKFQCVDDNRFKGEGNQ